MSGKIKPTEKEVANIAKLPLNERKSAVDCLGISKEERKAKEIARQIEEAFANGAEQETEEETPKEKGIVAPIPESAPTPKPTDIEKKEGETKEHEIEESMVRLLLQVLHTVIALSINS